MNNMLDNFTRCDHFPKWSHLVDLTADVPGAATPLSMSILLGIPSYLRHLLEQVGVDPNQGGTIVLAADKGLVEIVELLLQSGADVNQFDAEGFTALHRASTKNYSGVVRALLREGADMNKLTQIVPFDYGFPATQRSSIWYACYHGHEETVAELQACMRSSEDVERGLAIAVEYKRVDLVQILLKSHLMSFSHLPSRDSTDFGGLAEPWNPFDSEAGNSRN